MSIYVIIKLRRSCGREIFNFSFLLRGGFMMYETGVAPGDGYAIEPEINGKKINLEDLSVMI